MKITIKSSQHIESKSELLQLAERAFKSLFRGIDNYFKNFPEDEFKMIESKEVEEDGKPGKYYLFEVGDQGETLIVTLFPIEDNKDSFMIRIEGDDTEKFEKGPIKRDDIIDYVTDYCEKYDLGAVEDYIDAYV